MLLPHIEGDAALIRHNQADRVNGHLNLRPRHVVFAGNGAIVGGTSPLVRAIADATGKQVPEHAAASIAAVLGQEFRGRKYFALKDLSEILANMESLDEYFAEYYSFKAALARSYAESFKAGELKLRTARPLENLLETAAPADIGVITVNWDQCIWEESRFQSVIQLHGVASNPESIVLPGEYADDDALADILENLC